MKQKITNANKEPTEFFINHLYDTALYASQLTTLETGIHIIETGLAGWPEIRDREIEKLKKEM
ncbi:MAG TPA: hypothetical protein DF610_16195 [Sphingobacterium sp.]|nr:hypothetical protein FM120_31390 [Sphingobacterium faecium PCAi_F2.5]HCU46175.1 hypothetical protein [Sphingobacterium sp.]